MYIAYVNQEGDLIEYETEEELDDLRSEYDDDWEECDD